MYMYTETATRHPIRCSVRNMNAGSADGSVAEQATLETIKQGTCDIYVTASSLHLCMADQFAGSSDTCCMYSPRLTRQLSRTASPSCLPVTGSTTLLVCASTATLMRGFTKGALWCNKYNPARWMLSPILASCSVKVQGLSLSAKPPQPLLDCMLYLTQYPYGPGTSPSSANRCILGNMNLRSNLSRKL